MPLLTGCTLMLALDLGAPAPPATGFLYKTLTFDGQTCAYCVYVPPDYTPARQWPAILFLHGAGERGTDGLLQTEVGLGSAIRRDYRRVPAIVVMPQCRPDMSWVGPMGALALRCLDAAAREYALDPQRIYLTGLSLGGQGSWHLAARHPERFAAVVPVCGFIAADASAELTAEFARRLRRVPVWCFHGDADQAVPVERSREPVAALRQAGGNVRYTEYAGVGHNAWDRAYADRELWAWLFAQRLPAPPPADTQPAAAPPPGPARP